MSVLTVPTQELAGVRSAVCAGQAVRLLVLAAAQCQHQPVRLLAQVWLSLHPAGRVPRVWPLLLHLLNLSDCYGLLLMCLRNENA